MKQNNLGQKTFIKIIDFAMNLMVLCCFLKMDANYMITIKVKKTQKLIYRINALKLIMVINNKLIQRKD